MKLCKSTIRDVALLALFGRFFFSDFYLRILTFLVFVLYKHLISELAVFPVVIKYLLMAST